MVAGEASGDLHGARLLSELKKRLPEVRAFGLGGDELQGEGFEAVAHSSEIAVVGITEVLKILRRAREIFDSILAEVDRRGARWAILIDAPDFNLRLANQLRKRGVRVIYYISPQVWAWRKRRIHAIARDVDLMLVLFPFEKDFYRNHDVDVRHVGHPLVDEVPRLEQAWDRESRGEGPSLAPTLALLPGSRRSEINALLPWMLEAVSQVGSRRPDGLKCRLIQAPNIPDQLFDQILAGSRIAECGVEVERIRSNRFQAIADSHLAVCASGTATLEVALLNTPLLVMYRLKWTSYVLGKLLVDLPYFCMVNLVLDRGVVPELLQGEARPEKVAAQIEQLLGSPDTIHSMRRELAMLRPALGSSGASGRAAEAVAERIREVSS